MNFSKALLFAISIHQAHAAWYPDWQGGSNSCLNDGKEPQYMITGGYTKTTLASCCDYYFKWNLNKCLGSTFVPTAKWFVDYQNAKCQQDCTTAGTPAGCTVPGKLATPSDTLYTDAAACCAGRLSYIAPGLCTNKSLGTTYAGSGGYYVDYAKNKCVQDCAVSGAGCGGIITDSSTTLYADASKCCAAKLSYINKSLCESNSNAASTGTGLFYLTGTTCKKDSDASACPAGYACARLASPAPLFATADACCASIGWSDQYVCKSGTTGVTTTSTTTTTTPATTTATTTTAATTTTTTAAGATTTTTTTPATTTTTTTPVATTTTTTSTTTSTFSNKYYVDWTNSKCVKDCATGTGAACKGSPSEKTTILYTTSAACCAAHFSSMNQGVCTAASDGVAYAGSTSYYVDWTLAKCVKDCVGAAPCGGPRENWEPAFSSVTTCCSQGLAWKPFADCQYS